MNQLIFVETSIPSFYFETRPEPEHHQKKIGDYLREREKAMGDRIVRTQKRIVPAKS